MRYTKKHIHKKKHQVGGSFLSSLKRSLLKLKAYPKKLIPKILRKRFKHNVDSDLSKITATISINIDGFSEVVRSKLKYLLNANQFIGNIAQRYLFYVVARTLETTYDRAVELKLKEYLNNFHHIPEITSTNELVKYTTGNLMNKNLRARIYGCIHTILSKINILINTTNNFDARDSHALKELVYFIPSILKPLWSGLEFISGESSSNKIFCAISQYRSMTFTFMLVRQSIDNYITFMEEYLSTTKLEAKRFGDQEMGKLIEETRKKGKDYRDIFNKIINTDYIEALKKIGKGEINLYTHPFLYDINMATPLFKEAAKIIISSVNKKFENRTDILVQYNKITNQLIYYMYEKYSKLVPVSSGGDADKAVVVDFVNNEFLYKKLLSMYYQADVQECYLLLLIISFMKRAIESGKIVNSDIMDLIINVVIFRDQGYYNEIGSAYQYCDFPLYVKNILFTEWLRSLNDEKYKIDLRFAIRYPIAETNEKIVIPFPMILSIFYRRLNKNITNQALTKLNNIHHTIFYINEKIGYYASTLNSYLNIVYSLDLINNIISLVHTYSIISEKVIESSNIFGKKIQMNALDITLLDEIVKSIYDNIDHELIESHSSLLAILLNPSDAVDIKSFNFQEFLDAISEIIGKLPVISDNAYMILMIRDICGFCLKLIAHSYLFEYAFYLAKKQVETKGNEEMAGGAVSSKQEEGTLLTDKAKILKVFILVKQANIKYLTMMEIIDLSNLLRSVYPESDMANIGDINTQIYEKLTTGENKDIVKYYFKKPVEVELKDQETFVQLHSITEHFNFEAKINELSASIKTPIKGKAPAVPITSAAAPISVVHTAVVPTAVVPTDVVPTATATAVVHTATAVVTEEDESDEERKEREDLEKTENEKELYDKMSQKLKVNIKSNIDKITAFSKEKRDLIKITSITYKDNKNNNQTINNINNSDDLNKLNFEYDKNDMSISIQFQYSSLTHNSIILENIISMIDAKIKNNEETRQREAMELNLDTVCLCNQIKGAFTVIDNVDDSVNIDSPLNVRYFQDLYKFNGKTGDGSPDPTHLTDNYKKGILKDKPKLLGKGLEEALLDTTIPEDEKDSICEKWINMITNMFIQIKKLKYNIDFMKDTINSKSSKTPTDEFILRSLEESEKYLNDILAKDNIIKNLIENIEKLNSFFASLHTGILLSQTSTCYGNNNSLNPLIDASHDNSIEISIDPDLSKAAEFLKVTTDGYVRNVNPHLEKLLLVVKLYQLDKAGKDIDELALKEINKYVKLSNPDNITTVHLWNNKDNEIIDIHKIKNDIIKYSIENIKNIIEVVNPGNTSANSITLTYNNHIKILISLRTSIEKLYNDNILLRDDKYFKYIYLVAVNTINSFITSLLFKPANKTLNYENFPTKLIFDHHFDTINLSDFSTNFKKFIEYYDEAIKTPGITNTIKLNKLKAIVKLILTHMLFYSDEKTHDLVKDITVAGTTDKVIKASVLPSTLSMEAIKEISKYAAKHDMKIKDYFYHFLNVNVNEFAIKDQTKVLTNISPYDASGKQEFTQITTITSADLETIRNNARTDVATYNFMSTKTPVKIPEITDNNHLKISQDNIKRAIDSADFDMKVSPIGAVDPTTISSNVIQLLDPSSYLAIFMMNGGGFLNATISNDNNTATDINLKINIIHNYEKEIHSYYEKISDSCDDSCIIYLYKMIKLLDEQISIALYVIFNTQTDDNMFGNDFNEKEKYINKLCKYKFNLISILKHQLATANDRLITKGGGVGGSIKKIKHYREKRTRLINNNKAKLEVRKVYNSGIKHKSSINNLKMTKIKSY